MKQCFALIVLVSVLVPIAGCSGNNNSGDTQQTKMQDLKSKPSVSGGGAGAAAAPNSAAKSGAAAGASN